MGLKDLFYRETTPKPTTGAEPATDVEVETGSVPVLASGPLGSKRGASRMPRRSLAQSAVSKVNQEKLGDLRKRVLGEESALTLVIDSAAKLHEAGIEDPIKQYRGAIKTTGVTKMDVQDAIARHKTKLLQQREGFAKHVGDLRSKNVVRRQEIEKEMADLQQRFQELEQEDANLVQQAQDLDEGEQEFAQVADTLDAELVATGEQIVSLYQ